MEIVIGAGRLAIGAMSFFYTVYRDWKKDCESKEKHQDAKRRQETQMDDDKDAISV